MAKKRFKYHRILPARAEGSFGGRIRQGSLWRNEGGQKRQLRGEAPPLPASPLVHLPFTFRDPNLQEKYRVGLNRIPAREVPIEIKPVNPPPLNQLQSMEPKQMFWVRARGYIGKRTPWTGRKHSPGV